jgi:dehydrogenase/reductase SDR family member 12
MLRVPMFALLGLRTFTRGGYERASKNFQPSRMDSPNALDGRTVMVTGASPGGIGYQIALEAARRGATVHVVCRSEKKGRQAVDSIRSATQNANVVLKVCDLASLQSIKALAREYTDGERPEDLHVLVNNAGLMVHGGERSADGFELNFAVNTLGTYVLTRMLEPALQRCAPSRVVVVSSGGALTEHLEVDDLEMERRKGGVDGTVQVSGVCVLT